MAVALGVAVAGAGAAKVGFDHDEPVGHSAGESRVLQRAPASRRLSEAVTPDPTKGNLPWSARTYVNGSGATCVVIGQLLSGRLGRLNGRSFRDLPADAPGTCASNDPEVPLVAVRRYLRSSRNPPRTVVYGFVSREYTDVRLMLDGSNRTLPISNDGVFLAVIPGYSLLRGGVVDFRGARLRRAMRLG